MMRRLRLLLAGAQAGIAITAATPTMAQTPDAEQIRRREELILGQPARLAPPEGITDEMRALAAAPPGEARPGEPPNMYTIMLHSPEVLRRFRPMIAYFKSEGALAPRDRELAILRTCWLSQAPYAWGEHVAIGRRIGLTSDEIERTRTGSVAPGWSEHDQAILRAVEELSADSMISDATWATLVKSLREPQLIEVPMLVGHYKLLNYLQNSLRLPLRAGNPGLAAR